MTSDSNSGLLTVDPVPVHEKIYQEIVHALMSGMFAPGQKLTSRKLAAELGTSDMPVRSALSRLHSLRALDARGNGSMQVPQMTAEKLCQLMELRALLEGAATAAACDMIDDNSLRDLRRSCTELTDAAKLGDIDLYLRRNYEFKFSIYRHCNNDQLVFLIETLWMQVGPFLRSYASVFQGDLSGILEIDYHQEVLAALEAKDAARACEAISRDIEEGSKYLRAHAHFYEQA